MSDHCFISYSRTDGVDFVRRLADELTSGPPPLDVWVDERNIRAGFEWDDQVDQAIKTSRCVLFVMTVDSVEPLSGAKQEWTRALQYKKPIVPLRVHADATTPFRLDGRQFVDFADFQQGLAKLRIELRWLESPEGTLYLLERRLADAERDLQRSTQAQEQRRIEDEIAELEEEIASQRAALDDPDAVMRRVDRSIALGMEAEREGVAAPAATLERVINRPPGSAPSYFQDRVFESKLVGAFLTDDSRRILTVVGRAGVGKTAMTCRVLKELERGELVGFGRSRVEVDGIVYFGSSGSRPVSFDNLYADLGQILPGDARQALERVWNEQAAVKDRMLALVSAFTGGLAIVLLDNLEDVINPVTHEIADAELREALRELLRLPQHSIKVIITTRIAPRDLELEYRARYMRLDLDEGLESPFAENILQEMDADGKVGLRSAPVELLNEVRERTLGYPRALEAFFAILSADRHTRLEEVLSKAEGYLPENVVESLVAEAFHRLDPAAQRVMQVLAVLGRPLLPATVDYVLRPHEPTVDSTPVLRRLSNMYLVRSDQERYYLHPVDSAYAASQVPAGSRSDWLDTTEPVYSRAGLMYHGADYFAQVKTDPGTWLSIEDLAPQLAEFDLRVGCRDFDGALRVLDEVGEALWSWGHYRHTIAMCEQVLEGAASADWPQILLRLGEAHSACAEHAEAVRFFREAVAESGEQGNEETQLSARRLLAWSLYDVDRYEDARREFEELLELAEGAGNAYMHVAALEGLGAIEEAVGGTARAEELYREALAVYVPLLHIEVVRTDDDGFRLEEPEAFPDDVHVVEPDAWVFHGVLSSDAEDEAGEIVMFVVARGEPEPVSDDEQRFDAVAVGITEMLAGIWMDLASLYARTDRLDDADSCCRLAGQMYEQLGAPLRVARAVDLAERIASARADTATREEMKAARNELLAEARAKRNRREEVALLLDIAEAQLSDSAIPEAEQTYLEARAIAQELEDTASELLAEEGLARIDWVRGDTKEAIVRFQNLERRYRLGGVEEQRGRILKALGDAEVTAFDRDAASKHYLESLRTYFALGQPSGQIDAQIGLARLALDQRDYDGAIEWVLGALRVAESLGIRSTIASVQSELARAYNLAGRGDLARAAVEKARMTAAMIELRSAEATVLFDLGDISTELEAFDEALAAYERAGEISASLSDRFGELRALVSASDVHQQRDAHEQAITLAHAAVALAGELGDRDELRRAQMNLGLALSNAGRHAEAVRLLEEVVSAQPRDAIAVGNLGWVLYEAGEYERSIELSRRSGELDRAQAWTVRNVGHAYLALGRPEEAERAYREAIAARRGGEHFRETIREMKKLLARHPEAPRAAELLALVEEAQARLEQDAEVPA